MGVKHNSEQKHSTKDHIFEHIKSFRNFMPNEKETKSMHLAMDVKLTNED